jgi:hypothetical protein
MMSPGIRKLAAELFGTFAIGVRRDRGHRHQRRERRHSVARRDRLHLRVDRPGDDLCPRRRLGLPLEPCRDVRLLHVPPLRWALGRSVHRQPMRRCYPRQFHAPVDVSVSRHAWRNDTSRGRTSVFRTGVHPDVDLDVRDPQRLDRLEGKRRIGGCRRGIGDRTRSLVRWTDQRGVDESSTLVGPGTRIAAIRQSVDIPRRSGSRSLRQRLCLPMRARAWMLLP